MKCILLVDDSTTIRRMIMSSLRSLGGITFSEAGNGLEALERLAITPVDLMILDLNMPDMHGMEVLRFVRGHQSYQSVPIIMLTTKGDESSRSSALAAGASRYLTKPFDPRELVTYARELLRLEV